MDLLLQWPQPGLAAVVVLVTELFGASCLAANQSSYIPTSTAHSPRTHITQGIRAQIGRDEKWAPYASGMGIIKQFFIDLKRPLIQ